MAELVNAVELGPIELVVLQPTSFCNLDCSYCYLPHRNDRRTMRDDTLDAIGARVLNSSLAADPITVVWHGGEPMTLRPDWYDRAFRRLAQAAPDRRIDHCFQTNAIGVDEGWLDLWREWGVRIGVSLDGPQDLHDGRRRTRGGRGSFASSLRGAKRIQEAGLPLHVIAVLTAESISHPDRILDFFLDHGFWNFGFNIEEEENAHTRSSLRDPNLEAVFRRFMEHLFARILDLRVPVACRELDGVHWLARASATERRSNSQVTPLKIVSIGVDGAMSTYSPEFVGATAPEFANFAFGDVHREGPEAMLTNSAFLKLRADVETGIAACSASCAYFDVCGGGVPANKYFEHGHVRGAETLFCRLTRQVTLEAALAAMEAHARFASDGGSMASRAALPYRNFHQSDGACGGCFGPDGGAIVDSVIDSAGNAAELV
ncbi:uncharacterized protein GGE65_008211 [Skermanella aerolata]|uniref:cyclophane-forming radical SAM/SPASM peptide maturase GrrM/OscB n=1 Tax=Skermanella aerolata TaxID=393310 RepID=UPI003D20D286